MPPPLMVRPDRFEFPADLDPVWNRRRPELSCAANALSLLMPYAEPYVIRSTRRAMDRLEGAVRTEASAYIAQEAGHHAQHRRFNHVLAKRYRAVAPLEAAMGRVFRWLDRRSVAFGLAYAAGFETIAFASARWIDTHLDELFDGADPTVSGLFLWHLAEEVEHKCVAFDVHRAAGGSRWVHVAGLVAALVVMAAFTVAGTVALLAAERRLWHPGGWVRLVRWSVGYAFEVLPMMAVSLCRGHHPSQLADPGWLGLWLPDDGGRPSAPVDLQGSAT
jgi:uncharacterized protein